MRNKLIKIAFVINAILVLTAIVLQIMVFRKRQELIRMEEQRQQLDKDLAAAYTYSRMVYK